MHLPVRNARQLVKSDKNERENIESSQDIDFNSLHDMMDNMTTSEKQDFIRDNYKMFQQFK